MVDDVQPTVEEQEPQTTDNATGTESQTADEKRFTQAEVDALLKQRLQREKDAREKAEAKARADAEAKALEEQGKFKELADAATKRAEELEPYRAKAERYEAALGTLLEAERKVVPEWALPLLEKLDPAEQLEYIAANREKFARSDGGRVTETPRGSNGQRVTKEEQKAREARKLRQVKGWI